MEGSFFVSAVYCSCSAVCARLVRCSAGMVQFSAGCLPDTYVNFQITYVNLPDTYVSVVHYFLTKYALLQQGKCSSVY